MKSELAPHIWYRPNNLCCRFSLHSTRKYPKAILFIASSWCHYIRLNYCCRLLLSLVSLLLSLLFTVIIVIFRHYHSLSHCYCHLCASCCRSIPHRPVIPSCCRKDPSLSLIVMVTVVVRPGNFEYPFHLTFCFFWCAFVGLCNQLSSNRQSILVPKRERKWEWE